MEFFSFHAISPSVDYSQIHILHLGQHIKEVLKHNEFAQQFCGSNLESERIYSNNKTNFLICNVPMVIFQRYKKKKKHSTHPLWLLISCFHPLSMCIEFQHNHKPILGFNLFKCDQKGQMSSYEIPRLPPSPIKVYRCSNIITKTTQILIFNSNIITNPN